MISLEDIRTFLPKYLSDESTADLFAQLAQFPENIDQRLYSLVVAERESLLQGDGLPDLLVINLPNQQIMSCNAIILSNSCDINPDNAHLFSPSVCYCPILNLNSYERSLNERFPETSQAIKNQFITNIRKQRISQIFFLPAGGNLGYDGFVFFDKVCSCSNSAISREKLSGRKLFSLSNYGFYLFLFKLSIHFTRIRERVNRT